LNRVRGIACLPNGGFFLATQKGAHIWYVDTGGIIHKMIDCATSGSVNTGNGESYATPGIKMSEPRAITVAPNGDLIITASDYGHVRVVKSLRPPAPPLDLKLEPAPANTLRLCWNGAPWQSYFVESSTSLSPASWNVIGIRTSEPGAATLHPLSSPAASTGFFRVRAPR
jgi:hypothetical protein